MKRLKKAVSVFLVAGLLNCGVSAQETVKIYVNGMRIEQDGFLNNSSTFVPLRALSEALGANVTWDSGTNTAFVSFTEEDAIAQIVENVT